VNQFSTDLDLGVMLSRLDAANSRMASGDWGLWRELLSRRDDVVLLGAYGRYVSGWEPLSTRFEQTAAGYRAEGAGGQSTHEQICGWANGDLACTVTIEHHETRLDGCPDLVPFLYRATHVFRREEDGWKVVLRHADPLVTFVGPQVAHAIARGTGH